MSIGEPSKFVETVMTSIGRLFSNGLITANQVECYAANLRFFQDREQQLRALYGGKWIAIVDGTIYSALSERDAHIEIQEDEGRHTALVIQLAA